MPARPRLIIIGIDGATWAVMRPLMDAGELPVLADLCRRGRHGVLESTMPPVTPCAWTSMTTGVNPGKHGVYDFVQLDLARQRAYLTSANDRRCETVWEILAREGVSVGLVNVPWTYPPLALEGGFCLSGFGAPDFGPHTAIPSELFEVATKQANPWELETVSIAADDPQRAAAMAREEAEAVFASARAALRAHPVDVFMLGIMCADHAHHSFLALGFEQDGFAEPIRQAYLAIDEQMGHLLDEHADGATNVLVVSDHGGSPVHGRVNLDRVLADAGLVKLLQPKSRTASRAKRLMGTLMPLARVVRTMLPGRLKTKAGQMSRNVERLGTQRLDWDNTPLIAWGRYGAVSINPNAVTPAQAAEVTSRLRETLGQLQSPMTGGPVELMVLDAAELYHGPAMGWAPDFVICPRNWDYLVAASLITRGELKRSSNGSALGQLPAETLNVCATIAGHDPDGIVVACGPDILDGSTEPERWHITDVAPSVLRLCGFEPPEDMDGRPFVGVLRDDQPAPGGPVELRYRDDAGRAPQAGYNSEEEEKIEQRLRDLGYM